MLTVEYVVYYILLSLLSVHLLSFQLSGIVLLFIFENFIS